MIPGVMVRVGDTAGLELDRSCLTCLLATRVLPSYEADAIVLTNFLQQGHSNILKVADHSMFWKCPPACLLMLRCRSGEMRLYVGGFQLQICLCWESDKS